MKLRSSYLALALVVFCAGCLSAAETADLDGLHDPNAPEECVVDEDCVPAGSSCCDLATHAVPRSSGYENSCDDVSCTRPETSKVAMCSEGACVLRCAPVACETVCPSGYQSDSFGCLVCPQSIDECPGTAPPATIECTEDTDCTRVPADCCGCENGGTDTAVPTSEVDAFLGGLMCEMSPACPGVDVCQADVVPRCLNNVCILVDSGGGTDPGLTDGEVLCGSADLPTCPEGQVCVLNSPDAEDANMSGLGVCQLP